MLQVGIKGEQTLTVTDALTARTMGSGELDVFATPAMIALIEKTAWQSVAPALESGQGTVGTKLEIEHTAATPVGMAVRCETELVQLDRRRLVFRVQVFDEAGPVGQGTHERFVVDNARFLQKSQAKRA